MTKYRDDVVWGDKPTGEEYTPEIKLDQMQLNLVALREETNVRMLVSSTSRMETATGVVSYASDATTTIKIDTTPLESSYQDVSLAAFSDGLHTITVTVTFSTYSLEAVFRFVKTSDMEYLSIFCGSGMSKVRNSEYLYDGMWPYIFDSWIFFQHLVVLGHAEPLYLM